ncbi:MAG: MtrB/PioB family outer membrane beta-barrel protein [Deltaproteobacteria bacterium]|nr:MtrB/PioB family outer membrane beta-barrel protein [Deltaproteobacteria bacterium]
MRYNKRHCILNVSVVWLALCCGVFPGMAAENAESTPAAGPTVTPEKEEPGVYYETEGDYFLGYRWFSSEDSLKAAEYIYPHSSLTFGLDLLSCPLPYRYHANAEFLSNYDFYTDAGFAYQDLLLFRDILVGAHHNLDHLNYQLPGEPPGLVYTDRNAAGSYYTDFTSNLLSLRLKAADFPFHTFLNNRHVEQDGKVQQRFLLGDFDQLNITSQSRDIDWRSNALKLGANSHVGPVEIEYAHDQDEFNPGRHDILYDLYPASADLSRPADTYPHNVVPETESAANSVKLHSSYTGGIVAAATLSNLRQKNNYSLTESTTWKGAFDFSWIPDPLIGLFFKYRHKDLDMDTPETVTLTGLNNTVNYAVREGISYDRDVFSLSTRYRPLNILSLFGTYEFSQLERTDFAEWVAVPEQTDIHTINLTAHAKPLDRVKVKASYEYKNYSHPAYNNSPDNSNKLRLTTTCTPTSWLNVYLEYILSVTERDGLHYLNPSPALLLETGERDGQRDQFLASLSTELSPTVSLTASWFYQRWDVEQDLAYGKWLMENIPDLPYIDAGVPYSDESNSFSLALHYLPREDITLSGGLTYTLLEGEAGYDDVVGGAPFSLSSFSALKASEIDLSFEIIKKLSKEWDLGLRSYLDIYDDRAYGLLDGNVFTTTLRLKRYF